MLYFSIVFLAVDKNLTSKGFESRGVKKVGGAELQQCVGSYKLRELPMAPPTPVYGLLS